MINIACGVIRISSKCSCLEIFDQQGNPNLIPLVVIPYLIIWYQSFRLKIGYMFPLHFFSTWFLFIFIFLVFNRPKVQNSIFVLFKILRGDDMNQETSIIQYTSMKMWRKGCQNYQNMFQFMLHWRRIKFDCCKFLVGYNLE